MLPLKYFEKKCLLTCKCTNCTKETGSSSLFPESLYQRLRTETADFIDQIVKMKVFPEMYKMRKGYRFHHPCFKGRGLKLLIS